MKIRTIISSAFALLACVCIVSVGCSEPDTDTKANSSTSGEHSHEDDEHAHEEGEHSHDEDGDGHDKDGDEHK